MRSIAALMVVCICSAPVLRSVGAQRADTSRATGAFYGRLISASDSSTIARGEIRLLRIDSTRKTKNRLGLDSVEVFVDSGRTRVGTTDHSGEFAIRRIDEGRYLLQIRRLGFAPLQGVTVIDTAIVRAVFALQPTSQLLAGMTITETVIDKGRRKLDDIGFTGRSHFGAGQFLDRRTILKRDAHTVGELLRFYGVSDGDVVLDRLPVRYYDIENYPTDLVLGIEIYHSSRPMGLGPRQRGSALYPEGSRIGSLAPLVLIWTYAP